MQFNKSAIATTQRRIRDMGKTMTPDHIAGVLGMDTEDVEAIFEAAGAKLVAYTVECRRTGRTWNARSERGAYRLAQIKGLTEWDCYPATEADG